MKNKVLLFTGIIIGIIFASSCKISPAVLQGKPDIATGSKKSGSGPVTIAPEENLLADPGFENGTGTWYPFGDCVLEHTNAQAHSGMSSILVTNRITDWNGAAVDLANMLETDTTYLFYGWVMLDNASQADFTLTLKQSDGAGTNYIRVDSKKVTAGKWVQLSGEFKSILTGTVTEAALYFEGPGAGTNFYVDDVAVAKLN